MPDLRFTLSNVTSFLPDNLSGLKKNHIQVCIQIWNMTNLYSFFIV